MKLVSLQDLKTEVTLDEALKIYALWRMTQDIESAKAQEIKDKVNKGNKSSRR